MVELKAFLAKPKYQNRAYQWEECVYSAQSTKERRLLQESKFVQFERWTLILRKMVERKAFFTKRKHQNHASQWKEHVYSAQSQKRIEIMTRIQVCPF